MCGGARCWGGGENFQGPGSVIHWLWNVATLNTESWGLVPVFSVQKILDAGPDISECDLLRWNWSLSADKQECCWWRKIHILLRQTCWISGCLSSSRELCLGAVAFWTCFRGVGLFVSLPTPNYFSVFRTKISFVARADNSASDCMSILSPSAPPPRLAVQQIRVRPALWTLSPALAEIQAQTCWIYELAISLISSRLSQSMTNSALSQTLHDTADIMLLRPGQPPDEKSEFYRSAWH